MTEEKKSEHIKKEIKEEKKTEPVEEKIEGKMEEKKKKKGYGWVPDLPDHRDKMYGAVKKIPATLPSSVDLRPTCSPVENQGDLGSCTANALAGALQFLEKKDNVPYADLSRLFIYYNERAIEHTVHSDSGAQIRDGIKTLASNGVCPESMWQYDISKFTEKPGNTCYNEATKHKITLYQRIQTVDEMRTSLASGFPFVFGFTVYASFESQEVANTGLVPMPKPGEQVVGGHAVMAVGYDDNKKMFLVRNSWGTDWGLQGYFEIPYDYLANRSLSDDFWMISRGGEM